MHVPATAAVAPTQDLAASGATAAAATPAMAITRAVRGTARVVRRAAGTAGGREVNGTDINRSSELGLEESGAHQSTPPPYGRAASRPR